MKRAMITIFSLLILFLSAGNCLGQDSTQIRNVYPTGALLRSAIIPGWGQVYNHKYIKATFIAAGEGWLAYGIYNDWKELNKHQKNFQSATEDPAYQASEFAKYTDARDRRNLKMWILAAGIFYSMFDAYVDAQLANFNQTDKSFDVYLGPGHKDDFVVTLTFKIP